MQLYTQNKKQNDIKWGEKDKKPQIQFSNFWKYNRLLESPYWFNEVDSLTVGCIEAENHFARQVFYQ